VPRSFAVVRTVGNPLVKRNLPTSNWAVPHKPSGQNIARTARPAARKVNGFWVGVCQVVLISEQELAENPIDCRIFFADNPGRKTESGVGGKNP